MLGELVCCECQRPNVRSWFVSSALWTEAGFKGDDTVCPQCFTTALERIRGDYSTWELREAISPTGGVMGQNIVKGERMGLSPLAVQELAEEFRRLAAEAERASKIPTIMLAQRADARRGVWEQAAQMLEEKLNG